MRERDEALRALAAQFGGKGRAQARQLHEVLRRYAASGYLIDRKRSEAPTGGRGHLFVLLEATAGDGLSEDRLRKLLNGNDSPGLSGLST